MDFGITDCATFDDGQTIANPRCVREELPQLAALQRDGTVEAPGRRVRQKAGLNQEILSAGFGMAHPMLAYKAEEAGTRLHLSNTRQLKPSQGPPARAHAASCR